jgi:signal recognition particle subunit SRP54
MLDTAGRLHIDEALMAEVAAVRDATHPTETLLVVDAMTGQDAVNVGQSFAERIGITGIVLTRVDGDARGGAALSMRAVTGKPIKFDRHRREAGRHRAVPPGAHRRPHPRHGRRRQPRRARTARQLYEGAFDFQDFLRMLEMIKGMGPIKDLLKMVPGMGAHMDSLEGFDDKEFLRAEAMIRSMTPQERSHPEILNVSRRERVARGSGSKLEDVHNLVRGFKEMKGQIKDLKKAGILGKMIDPSRALQKQKRAELKELDAQGKSVLDLPAFRSLRPGQKSPVKKKSR